MFNKIDISSCLLDEIKFNKRNSKKDHKALKINGAYCMNSGHAKLDDGYERFDLRTNISVQTERWDFPLAIFWRPQPFVL